MPADPTTVPVAGHALTAVAALAGLAAVVAVATQMPPPLGAPWLVVGGTATVSVLLRALLAAAGRAPERAAAHHEG